MIRTATADDLNFIYDLYMHPQVNPFLLYEPMDKEQFIPIYEKLLTDGVKFIFYSDGVPKGMFKLIPLTHRTRHVVYLGGVAIHPSFSGKGAGGQMLQEIIDFCRQRGFLRIELSATIHNTKAIRLYEKYGFEKEGVLRNYGHLASENRYHDEILMSYLFPLP